LAFGWAHEDMGEAEPPDALAAAAPRWDPPPPDEARAYRRARATEFVYLAASAASTTDNQFIGAGLVWRRDHDRWDRRAGPAFGLQLEADHGTIDGAPHAGSVSVAPLFALYLLPDRLALTALPALVTMGSFGSPGLGFDVAGRAGVVFDLGRIELAVDSPPLSYVSRARWHALPLSVRLGLLF
jgi:hypothetical protein